MIRHLFVVEHERANDDDDPVLAYIGEGLRQSMDCDDTETWKSWLDTLAEVQETRAAGRERHPSPGDAGARQSLGTPFPGRG